MIKEDDKRIDSSHYVITTITTTTTFTITTITIFFIKMTSLSCIIFFFSSYKYIYNVVHSAKDFTLRPISGKFRRNLMFVEQFVNIIMTKYIHK